MKKPSSPAVTLRNLPPALLRQVEQRARAQGSSLNKAVIGLLEEATGSARGARKRTVYHDLDGLVGKWTVREAAVFEKALAELRVVDEEIWR